MIDSDRLKQIIAQNGLSQRKVADYLGISAKTFYAKLKKGVFDSDEIELMVNLLAIPNPAGVFFASHGTRNVPIQYLPHRTASAETGHPRSTSMQLNRNAAEKSNNEGVSHQADYTTNPSAQIGK